MEIELSWAVVFFILFLGNSNTAHFNGSLSLGNNQKLKGAMPEM